MDIRRPGTDGLTATRAITSDDDLAGAGASGFIGKGVEPAALLDAIRVVAAGEALLSPKATRALTNVRRRFDPRRAAAEPTVARGRARPRPLLPDRAP